MKTKTSDNNRKNGIHQNEEVPTSNGQNFGGDFDIPQLPPALEEKIKLAKRLNDQIEAELKDLTFGPSGEPVIPPGLPHEVIFEDEINKIKEALEGIKYIPPGIKIADVELTQSTQFFNYDNQSSGAGGDNSIPLVAHKDLIIRVYVEKRQGFTAYHPATVTGKVRFAGQEFAPLNGPIALLDRALVRRSNINHTLNFRIPAALCHGNRTFLVRVFDSAYTPGGIAVMFRPSRTVETFYASFRDVPPLRVSGVMINYVGPPNFNLPAPVGTDLPPTLSRFLPMFPIHGFDFGPCTVTSWGDDMKIKGGVKGSGWDSLLTFITNLRSASTIRTFYVGLLPANLSGQISAWQRGIGNAGVAIAAKDDTRALSHELGHAMYLKHLNDGMAEGPFETNYPKYNDGTFPYGSIGEFGLNSSRMTLFDPNTSYDLMTYFDAGNVPFPTNTWISPYHYQRMMNFLTASDGTGDLKFTIIVVVVVANFRVYRDGRVELLPSYIVDRVNGEDSGPIVDSVMLDIHGANGEIVRSQRCHRHNPYQELDGPFVDYHEIIPWSEEFTGFSIIRNGETIHTVKPSENRPSVRLDEMRRVQRNGDMMHLKWNIDSANEGQQTMIRYTNDNGETWQAIAAGVKDGSHLVNLDLLPGGKECRLEIIASGLNKASEQTEPFEVPIKPRKGYLISPQDGDVFKVGTPITFTGGGYSPDHDACSFDEVSWHSNIQGYLGTGNQLVKTDLILGTHRITMTLPDGTGGEAKAGVWIKVVEEITGTIDDNCHNEKRDY